MSGRLQIATRGIQSEWINGTPTQSHFLFSLRKHTKFAFDTLEIPVSGAAYDRESICFIPLDAGDLVTRMTLRYRLGFRGAQGQAIAEDALYFQLREQIRTSSTSDFASVHLIDHVDLYIGGVLIQRLTSRWIQLYNKVHYERSLYEALKESANFVRGELVLGLSGATVPPAYVDLPFYFNDNLKSSILACKLQKQNCYVKIKFKSPIDIIETSITNNSWPVVFQNFYGYPIPGTGAFGLLTTEDIHTAVSQLMNEFAPIENISILTQYAYLSPNELQYIQGRPIEQIITQIQLKRFDVPKGETKRVQLNFKHPVKTIYFFLTQKKNIDGQALDESIKYMDNVKFTNAKLRFNGQLVFDDGPEKLIYANSMTNTRSGMSFKFLTDTDPKMRVGSYSFAMYPLKNEPTGHINFSRIINQEFEIKAAGVESYPNSSDFIDLRDINECQVYAESYNILHYSSGLVGLKF